MNYRLAAFDFDGTLADSFGFFVANVNSLARRHGFREMDPSRLEEYRGREPRELMRLHGLPMCRSGGPALLHICRRPAQRR